MEVLKHFDDEVKPQIKIKSKAVQHLQIINENDEYGTPTKLFKDACKKYQIKCNVDVCASKANHKSEYYITQNENFLNRTDGVFSENMFANFPYSKQLECMKHAWEMFKKHKGNWLILAYSKTDTEWWHEYVEDKAEVHFIRGRVKFLNKDGNPLLSRYCLDCKKKRPNGEIICQLCSDPYLQGNHTVWKENTSPYPSCWIIYRNDT